MHERICVEIKAERAEVAGIRNEESIFEKSNPGSVYETNQVQARRVADLLSGLTQQGHLGDESFTDDRRHRGL